MKDLEDFTAKIDEAKEESKQACEKVMNDLSNFTEKLCETEKEKKALDEAFAGIKGVEIGNVRDRLMEKVQKEIEKMESEPVV